MTKAKIILATIALLVAGIVIIVQQRQQIRLLETDRATLQESNEQLRIENRRVAEASKSARLLSEAELRELMQLRARATEISESEKQSSQLKAERDHLSDQLSLVSSGEAQLQQTTEQKALMAKLSFAQAWGMALRLFADEHDGQLPASLKEPMPFIDTNVWQNAANTFGFRTDQFELIYHGSLKQLKEPGQTILIRETQPMLLHDGRWAKVYLLGDFHSELKAIPDSNFDDWEKEHTGTGTPTASSP